jgi:predicted transcriptional regulator
MSLQILTRRNASCNELLCSIYNLNPVDLDIYYQLAGGKSASLDELAQGVERDRSTVHRSLQKLVSTGLCYKEVRGLKDGGYYHVYSAMELSKVRDQAERKVREITAGLERMLKNFESDVKKRCCT